MKTMRLDLEEKEEARLVHKLQDKAIKQLSNVDNLQFRHAKLCGGTALERLWLHHRLSYDLDFFLALGFDATALSKSIKSAGLRMEVSDLIDGQNIANQLHGFLVLGEDRLKVSFIEDAYFDLFPSVESPMGENVVRSEAIDGLYHRKLRTVSGSAADGETVIGGRQKARDLFDLYVLSKSYKPLMKFMESLPYEFPADAFNNGLVSMPWFDIQEELSEVICASQWKEATRVSALSGYLYEQIGAVSVDDRHTRADGPKG